MKWIPLVAGRGGESASIRLPSTRRPRLRQAQQVACHPVLGLDSLPSWEGLKAGRYPEASEAEFTS